MRSLHVLDALLPKTRQGILAATLVQPEKAWYTSELARRMGVPSSSLQRELRDLSEVGILKIHRQVYESWNVLLANVELFKQRRKVFAGRQVMIDVGFGQRVTLAALCQSEFRIPKSKIQLFPEELTPVQHAAAGVAERETERRSERELRETAWGCSQVGQHGPGERDSDAGHGDERCGEGR